MHVCGRVYVCIIISVCALACVRVGVCVVCVRAWVCVRGVCVLGYANSSQSEKITFTRTLSSSDLTA